MKELRPSFQDELMYDFFPQHIIDQIVESCAEEERHDDTIDDLLFDQNPRPNLNVESTGLLNERD